MLKEIILCFCVCVVSTFAQRMTGTVDAAQSQFQVSVQIADEGSFAIQRATVLGTWATVTNFNSLAGLSVGVKESMAGTLQKYFRVLRQTNQPAIQLQSQSISKFTREEVKLQAAVTGSWPLRLQWYKGATVISGATNPTFSFTGKAADSGIYQLRATNLWGLALSSNVQVQVTAPSASTISGKTIHFDLQGGRLPLVTSGNYNMTANANGSYSMLGSSAFLTDQGYWAYTRTDENTGYIQLSQSFIYNPDGLIKLSFTTTTNGSFLLTAGSGYQFGTFSFTN
jgi:hypothetical protein